MKPLILRPAQQGNGVVVKVLLWGCVVMVALLWISIWKGAGPEVAEEPIVGAPADIPVSERDCRAQLIELPGAASDLQGGCPPTAPPDLAPAAHARFRQRLVEALGPAAGEEVYTRRDLFRCVKGRLLPDRLCRHPDLPPLCRDLCAPSSTGHAATK